MNVNINSEKVAVIALTALSVCINIKHIGRHRDATESCSVLILHFPLLSLDPELLIAPATHHATSSPGKKWGQEGRSEVKPLSNQYAMYNNLLS